MNNYDLIYGSIIYTLTALGFYVLYLFYKKTRPKTVSLGICFTKEMLDNENIVRRRWLKLLILVYLSSFIADILTSVSLSIIAFPTGNVVTHTAEMFKISFVGMKGFVRCWIPYYCAYKNRGTNWLVYSMILNATDYFLTILSLLFKDNCSFWELSIKPIREAPPILQVPMVVIAICCFVISIFYFINSWRLYEVNLYRLDTGISVQCNDQPAR